MYFAKRFWIRVLTLSCFLGCGARLDPGSDSSTHWLSCTRDEDCGPLVCLERVCQEAKLEAPTGGAVTSPQAKLALGEVCLPALEYEPTFPGFDPREVTVQMDDQCASGTCLVNHFAGRLTCLYGGQETCETPTGEEVSVAVRPQLEDRPPEAALYCSCRCDGPEPTGEYCECGPGFECLPLIPLPVDGAERVTGSYCVKEGTSYEQPWLDVGCDRLEASCGEADRYSADALDLSLTEQQRTETVTMVSFRELMGSAADETTCLAALLPVVGSKAACRLFELQRETNDCSGVARSEVTPDVAEAARSQLAEVDVCLPGADCNAWRVCEVTQITDPESSCRTEQQLSGDGWCYVSGPQELGNPALLASCPEDSPGSKIRFAGAGALVEGAFGALVCSGER